MHQRTFNYGLLLVMYWFIDHSDKCPDKVNVIDPHNRFSNRSEDNLPQKQYWYYLRFPRTSILLATNPAEMNRAMGELR